MSQTKNNLRIWGDNESPDEVLLDEGDIIEDVIRLHSAGIVNPWAIVTINGYQEYEGPADCYNRIKKMPSEFENE